MVVVDWYALVAGTKYENFDVRCADVVLDDCGFHYSYVEAFLSDDEEASWQLAVWGAHEHRAGQ